MNITCDMVDWAMERVVSYPYSERRNLHLCLQVDICFDLELSMLDLLAVVMKFLSQRQRLQRDLEVYDSAHLRIFHATLLAY